ncbi:hypothetical protein L1D52_01660 [Vibrio brasiliensis]|uniref:hypothetical protein n=1 Tax=Vibrio brasiliensis TaxID=170652 RepID=UPI001EFE5F52|nr:hypothetical protein [Vibrio brasiliensis]MCG9781068.1 hypothetical protein [Vibrio brasiliensis]
MKKLILIFFVIIGLTACQSTSEKEPDVKVTSNLVNKLNFQASISNEVPLEHFQAAVLEKLKEENPAWADSFFYFSGLANGSSWWRFYKRSAPKDTSNVATHTVYTRISWESDEDNHYFNIVQNQYEPMTGLGYGFDLPNAKVKNFDFEGVERALLAQLNSLRDISINVNESKRYSGNLTLKNNDVTAFANIQRLHNNSFLSTNTKTDSEKSGSFNVNVDSIQFNFSLYPYKSVSKAKYNFKIPLRKTVYVSTHNLTLGKKVKAKPAQFTFDPTLNKKVIQSALLSFNN